MLCYIAQDFTKTVLDRIEEIAAGFTRDQVSQPSDRDVNMSTDRDSQLGGAGSKLNYIKSGYGIVSRATWRFVFGYIEATCSIEAHI